MSAKILIIDDELSMRELLSILFSSDGYTILSCASAEEALTKLNDYQPDIILSDMNLPGISGLELLEEVRKWNENCPFVVITAFGSTDNAVRAMKLGASNYVLKPFNNDELRLVVQRSLGSKVLLEENTRLKGALENLHFGRLVGSSRPMMQVYDLIRRVKDNRINCMILGESGTGKEQVARAIHFNSNRKQGPFVALNCGAIPETLMESELFGHKKGSFTGAIRDKVGLFQAADSGTLFLDEIDALPLSEQVKILRAIQERKILPIGGVQEISIDVRIICATNHDLELAIKENRFRDDLYYRLNVVEIFLPPLRERGEDIHLLTRHFLQKYSLEYGKQVMGIAPDAMNVIRVHPFYGNIRELQNLIERAVALCIGGIIQCDDLPRNLVQPHESKFEEKVSSLEHEEFPAEGVNLDAILLDKEREWINKALAYTDGNKTNAAKLLGMTFRSFRYRLSKMGLE